MNRGENPGALLREQLEHDRTVRTIDRLHDLIEHGAKGLAMLNGGAVVAMLAFIQALVTKTSFAAFKPFAIGALSCFLFGAILSAVAFFFHHTYVNHAFQDSPRTTFWRRIVWGTLITSSLLAVIGAGLVTVGIYVAV